MMEVMLLQSPPLAKFSTVKLELPPSPAQEQEQEEEEEEEPAGGESIRFSWRRVYGLLGVLLSSVMFCTGAALAKQVQTVSSSEVSCVQCVVGLLLGILGAFHQDIDMRVPRHKVLLLTTVSVSGSLGILLTVYCVQHLRLGDTILFLYTAPLLAGLFAKVIYREHFGVVNFTSAFACFLGALFTFQPTTMFSKLAHEEGSLGLGDFLLAVLGAVSLGVCYISLRVQGPGVSPLTSIFWINISLLPASVVLHLVTADSLRAPPCGADRAYLLLSGGLLFASLVVLFRALSLDVTTPAVLMRNMDLVLGYLYQVFWFKQDIDLLNVIGLVMVAGGVSAVFAHRLLKNVRFGRDVSLYQPLEEELEIGGQGPQVSSL